MTSIVAPVGVIGATTLVGEFILAGLARRGIKAVPFSRGAAAQDGWRNPLSAGAFNGIAACVCAAPVWVMPAYLSALAAAGVRRVVVLSSTSRFTKVDSDDAAERAVAQRLRQAEDQLVGWARQSGVTCVILRPTLIYGAGRDKNISEIARFIRRFGFFPLLGEGQGLRQPVHAEDVAVACLNALDLGVSDGAFNIPGGETLTYREMVRRIFLALGRPPVIVTVPLWCFRVALRVMRILPRYRKLTPAMARRMSRDLVFSHADAAAHISYSPRKFIIDKRDMPGGRGPGSADTESAG